MTNISQTLSKIDRLIATAKEQHRGPKLWLLSSDQRKRYDEYVNEQRKRHDAYREKFGSDYYYKTILSYPNSQDKLPKDIRETLGYKDVKLYKGDNAQEIYYRLVNGDI